MTQPQRHAQHPVVLQIKEETSVEAAKIEKWLARQIDGLRTRLDAFDGQPIEKGTVERLTIGGQLTSLYKMLDMVRSHTKPAFSVNIEKWFFLTGDVFSDKGEMPTTLDEAFEKSIAKWMLLAEGRVSDNSHITTCGLCNLYNRAASPDLAYCLDCPIYKTTGQPNCYKNIPYRQYTSVTNHMPDIPPFHPELMQHAADEVVLLKKLRVVYYDKA